MSAVLMNTKSKRDRVSLSVKSVRELIENYRDDTAWEELPFTKKIIVMVRDAAAFRAAAEADKKDS